MMQLVHPICCASTHRRCPHRKQGSSLRRDGICRRRPLTDSSQRALTGSEAREMLEPVLDALVMLHSFGYVHSRITFNILATRDRSSFPATLSSPLGESASYPVNSTLTMLPKRPHRRCPPPRTCGLSYDLVQTLTQRTCALHRKPGGSDRSRYTSSHFLDVARHALRADPRRRWSVPKSRRASIQWPSLRPPPQSVSHWRFRSPLSPQYRQRSCKFRSSKQHCKKREQQQPRPPATNPPDRAGTSQLRRSCCGRTFGCRGGSWRSRKSLAIALTLRRPPQRPLCNPRRDQILREARAPGSPREANAPTATQNSLKAAEKKAPPEPRSSVVPTPTPAAVAHGYVPSASSPSHSGSSPAG